MKKIAILAVDGVVPLDIAIPCDVFTHARLQNGAPAYDVRVCGPRPTIASRLFELKIRHGLDVISECATLIVPGVFDVGGAVPPKVLEAIRRAVKRGTRVASICSGSFILARAGVLDGREVTTHWMGAEQMAREFPKLRVKPDVLYVDGGSILTSAGAAAGLDLCLHMVRKDYGARVAADSARMAVTPLERHGGQAQFIKHAAPQTAGSLGETLAWLERHAHRPLALEDIARRAKLSERTLVRRFKEQVGASPIRWVIRLRVKKGQALLESSGLSVEEIAERVGFGYGTSFRDHFKRQVGVSPREYRANFGAPR